MRYFLIDKIKRIIYGKELTAVKYVTNSEDYFTDHFPEHPVMPGALQIESVAQACTALIEISCNLNNKAILLMVQKAKFRKIVGPGEELIIDVKIKTEKTDSVLLECKITSGKRRVMDCDIIMGIADINNFYPESHRRGIMDFYNRMLIDAEVIR
jgi:3-hydroxyacyl-[acyl-carrier-protein] dehydratase